MGFASVVVEGDLDAAVVRRLATDAGLEITALHVKGGKQKVRARIDGYNAASQYSPFIVLVDLDTEYRCAPDLSADWLPDRQAQLGLRVAVRSIEAWLLGDMERIANFLRAPRVNVPRSPERILDPKAELVGIARSSRSRAVREDMVPRPESGRRVGPAYSSRLIEFVSGMWRPEIAAESCDSLARARTALSTLAARVRA